MAVEALKRLPRAKPRSFVPDSTDFGDWAQVEPLLIKLEENAKAITTPEALEKWVLDVSEFDAAISEEGAKRYIDKSCQTDDADAKKAYEHFTEVIEPNAKPHWQKINQLFLDNPFTAKLPAERWKVYIRNLKKEVELYRDKNVPLQVEEEKLKTRYGEIAGAMTVHFQGQEITLQRAGMKLEETNRELRREVWELIQTRRLQDKEAIEEIYDGLVKLRHTIATNADMPTYREFSFKAKGRFDYTPKECEDFHKAVEEVVVPLARQIQERRRTLLGVDVLKPYDLAVDVKNRAPLKPFTEAQALVDKCHSIFNHIDPVLAKDYNVLRTHALLDLDSRKGKQPGGYQCSLEEARLPFIFMNAVGLHRDVETMLHEAGHAFHSLATRDEEILMYRSAPMEFCEVASMSMELLGGPHLTEFYSEADANRARRSHLEGIIGILPWIATIDAFQHWVYTHPNHTRDERKAHWLSLLDRFGGIESYAGFEDVRAYMWHRQGHLFGSPFYYIEYGIAQLGALQLWLNSKKDVADAVASYRKALALGGSVPLPELFTAAKIKFDFGPKTVAPLVKEIQKELATMEDA